MTGTAKLVADLIGQAKEDTAPAFSEEALALAFADRHVSELRNVAVWNRWLVFDGKRWKFDDTKQTFSLARHLGREEASKINKAREAKSIASAKTRAATVSLASDDRRLAATVDQWDANPWLLNTPAGVVDLRNGQVREHRAEDYLTKITTIAPNPKCPTPLWNAFLDTVMAGDRDMQDYLKRMCGYMLTGSTREHALFFLHGEGANGKSVFMKTIADILGDYHKTATVETFTVTKSEQHPTELARLVGARLVAAIETEEGKRWAESRIKALTGGDRVTARFMRQDFFEYVPQFKLLIAGNHKPGLRSVDEAIRRRFNLIPFSVTIPPEERDDRLGEKLVDEWPGILAWMIDGCMEWQANGLNPPQAVIEATNEYLEAEDAIKLWLEDCCTLGNEYWTPVGVLFSLWEQWATASGEFKGSIRQFSQRLETHGFKPKRGDSRGFQGLSIHVEPPKFDRDGKPEPRELKWMPSM